MPHLRGPLRGLRQAARGRAAGRRAEGSTGPARAFTTNAKLAPTNNAAEQALRSIVLKRKISGPTRSLRGDHFLSRGFSVHETCLRQGRDVWEFMHSAVHAFIANAVPPSLLPQTGAAVPAPTG